MQPLYVVDQDGDIVPLEGEWLIEAFKPWLVTMMIGQSLSAASLLVIAYLLWRAAGAL